MDRLVDRGREGKVERRIRGERLVECNEQGETQGSSAS